jgi:hypothetical protein
MLKIAAAVSFVASMSCQSTPCCTGQSVGVVRHPYREIEHSRDILTSADLLAHPSFRNGTLFDAIVGLRPEFLAANGPIANLPERPGVLLNGESRADVDVLRAISPSMVVSVRLVRPREAIVRYGQAYSAGAIIVTLNSVR